MLACTVPAVDLEIVLQAEKATAMRLTHLAAKVSDAVHSHEMFLAAVDAEMRIGSDLDATTKAIATIFDFLVTLAHESLLVNTTDSTQRAVRLLDLRLEIDHEFTLWKNLHGPIDSISQTAFAAAVARIHGDPGLFLEAEAPVAHVLLVDPLLFAHAARDTHEQDLLVAIYAANPAIQLYDLITAARATALPHSPNSSPYLP